MTVLVREAPHHYRRSSFCAGGNCVEIAFLPGDQGVLMRDSKTDDSQFYSAGEWTALLAEIKSGRLDLG